MIITEDVAKYNGMEKCCVISAIGVRKYYEKKHQYVLDESMMMIKDLKNYHNYLYNLYLMYQK